MHKTTFLLLLVVGHLAISSGDDLRDGALHKLQKVLSIVKRQTNLTDSSNSTDTGSLNPMHIHSEDCGCGPPATAPPGGGGSYVIGNDGAENGRGSYRNVFGYGYQGDKWGSEYRNGRNQYGYELD